LRSREAIAGEQDREHDRDRRVARDDRAQHRDRPDRERAVEGQVGHPADRPDQHEHRDLCEADVRQGIGCQHQPGERDQRREVKAEHHAERADAAGGDRREVVGQPPGERGAEAERDAH
jgi:hypothetical protein